MNLLHRNATPGVLGFCRIVVFGVWLILLLLSPLPQLADFPVDWLARLGFMGLVPRSFLPLLLDPVVLWSIYITMWVLGGLVVLGVRPFLPFAVVLAALLTLYEALTKGFSGYPSHAQAAVLYCAWILAIFPSADGLSVFGRRREAQNPTLYPVAMIAMTLVVAFTYMAIGIRRFVVGGLEIFTSDTILNYIAARSAEYSQYGFDYGPLLFDSSLLTTNLKIGYFLTTVFEVLAPLCLFSRRFRYLWLVFIAFFHVASLLTMNIFFWENLFLLVVLLTPLPYLFARQNTKEQSKEDGLGDRSIFKPANVPSKDGYPPDLPLPVVFYDGECGLCNGFVQWVLRRDKQGRFHFATLQGKLAARVIGSPQGSADEWSVVLADEVGVHMRSEASIRTLSGLGGVWRLATVLLWIPREVRDAIYEFIARRRYRWFGKVDACRLPTQEERSRFLA